MKVIDLRSDTVTLPTEEMRKAMYEAEVGDDVFGEDPTVNKLQELAAKKAGKEAGLLVASGTMGNLISMLSHCNRGEDVITGDRSHIYRYEQGGAAALGGIHLRALPNNANGTLDIDAVESAINPDDPHFTKTKMIGIENTFNGRVLPASYARSIGQLASRHNLKVHLDGARIFNAAAALNVPVANLTSEADSIQFCFSKGLAAPVGSVVCGTKTFIDRARRMRKVVGGGMRQAGVIAAACIVALETMTGRLIEDHDNARLLARGLGEFGQISVNLDEVDTNMVFINITDDAWSNTQLVDSLKIEGVRLLTYGPGSIRAVTHYGIDSSDINLVLSAFSKVLKSNYAASQP